MICFGRPYHFKFFEACLPQILLDLFLNTLTHILRKHVDYGFKYVYCIYNHTIDCNRHCTVNGVIL